MDSSIMNALMFLVRTLFNLCFMIVLFRFLFQLFQIDFYNPLSQFIFKATNPVLIPLRKIIPKHPKVDLASLLLLITLKGIEFSGITLLTKGMSPNIISLVLWPVGEILSQTINVFIFAILMVTIQSWLNPKNFSPLTTILIQFTDPLMIPARKLLPSTAGIDFSPIIVLVLLKLADILLANPITQLGERLTY